MDFDCCFAKRNMFTATGFGFTYSIMLLLMLLLVLATVITGITHNILLGKEKKVVYNWFGMGIIVLARNCFCKV